MKNELKIILENLTQGVFVVSEKLEIVNFNKSLYNLLKQNHENIQNFNTETCFIKDVTLENISNFIGKMFNFKIENNTSIEINQSLKEIIVDIFNSNNYQDGSTIYNYYNFDIENIPGIRTLEMENNLQEIKIKILKMNDKTCILVMIENISERIKMQTLQKNNNFKNQIFSSFSHEIKTPLNGAIVPIESCISDPETPPGLIEKYLKYSQLSLVLLSNKLFDFVDFALILSNNISLDIKEFNFFDFLNEIQKLIKIQTDNKNISFIHKFKNLSEKIRCDKQRLQQILINLLGYIKLTVKQIDTNPNKILIKIKDTGIGMNSFQQNIINKILKTQDIPQDSEMKMACLGLVIAQNLTKLISPKQDGLKFTSKEKKGSIFSFVLEDYKIENDENYFSESNIYLPEDRINKLLPQIVTKPINISGNFSARNKSISTYESYKSIIKKSVLIVDDEPFNLIPLGLILKKYQLPYYKAFNGEEAYDILLKKKDEINLVFMDYQMPILNGKEATIKIKKNKTISDIIIVGCSAFDSKKDVEECLKAGMNAYLKKPITQEKVKEVLLQFDLI